MTRRIKRLREFELSLHLKDETFINPPHQSQRNWLLNRSINEFASDLFALDNLAKHFVPGAAGLPAGDRTQATLSEQEIMEDWQIPLMRAMVEVVTQSHGNVLEIGFGRGVASTMIQECGVRSHTIIECNDNIVESFEDWRRTYSDREISIVHGLWQEKLCELDQYDGIFFHTYPLNESEFVDQIGESVTFAEHFFPHAAAHLVDAGIFTYLSNEIDSLSRAHQRLLFRDFGTIQMQVVRNLKLPTDVKDAWWSDSMVIVKAIK